MYVYMHVLCAVVCSAGHKLFCRNLGLPQLVCRSPPHHQYTHLPVPYFMFVVGINPH